MVCLVLISETNMAIIKFSGCACANRYESYSINATELRYVVFRLKVLIMIVHFSEIVCGRLADMDARRERVGKISDYVDRAENRAIGPEAGGVANRHRQLSKTAKD